MFLPPPRWCWGLCCGVQSADWACRMWLPLYRSSPPPRERFGTKFTTAVNGFYKSLDDTFKNFTLTAENGLEQIRAQSIGGGAAKGE